MLADNMEYPPMLPLITHDAKFVFCTDLELQQFATNSALVAQLQDALACWLSHIKDIKQERSDFLARLDAQETINLADVEPQLRQMELVLSFPAHFDRKEVLSVTRLLGLVPSSASNLKKLDQELNDVRALHEEVVEALSYVSRVAEYLRASWDVMDVAETIPPLFSALRALWVCSRLFGPSNPGRFSACVAHVVQCIERSVHDASWDAIDRIIASPSVTTTLKCRLVAGQDSIVTVQECYYALKNSLSEGGVTATRGPHIVLADVDDGALFSLLEWQYERIKGLLMAVDVLKGDPNKIGSALTDPLSHVDLMDPDAMSVTAFLKHLHSLQSEDAASASAILARIQEKSSGIGGSSPSPGKRSGATAAALAPRIPFDQLASGLIILLEFNPPCVTVMGGPLSANFLDSAQYTLPSCCSNEQARRPTRKATEAVWITVAPNVQQLRIHEQFCDDLHIAYMMLTILDLLEAEDAWRMTDSMSISKAVGQESHWLMFRKHRSKKKRREGSEPLAHTAGRGAITDGEQNGSPLDGALAAAPEI